ncbi:STAS domain-containing protein [Klenkia sp. LSe6-5]|uniref:STAS domain-containing protein n=1 Tax=Klenkia sesuvii TaxID=3103137 RepID=A0ABU8DSB1_9ACTN
MEGHGDGGFSLTTAESGDGELVAHVAGTLDAAYGPALQHELLQALRRAPRRLVVDLSEVVFFGSAGVTALVWVSQHPEAADKHVRVIATSRIVTGPLEMTGLLLRLDVSGMPPESVPPAGPTAPVVPPSG